MKTVQFNTGTAFIALAAMLFVSGCGGTAGAASTMIAGTVKGLTGESGLVLLNNGSGALSITGDGNFFFNQQVTAGTPYAVTVKSNPTGQTCTVTNGTGIVGKYAEDVSGILVTCTPVNGAVFGVVSGLNAGAKIELQDLYSDFNSTVPDTLAVEINGTFLFPTLVKPGFSYQVSITGQPVAQTCTIKNGTGNIPAKGGITATLITCQ